MWARRVKGKQMDCFMHKYIHTGLIWVSTFDVQYSPFHMTWNLSLQLTMYKQQVQSESHTKFEVSVVVTKKMAVFRDVTVCSIYKLTLRFHMNLLPWWLRYQEHMKHQYIPITSHSVTSQLTVLNHTHWWVDWLLRDRSGTWQGLSRTLPRSRPAHTLLAQRNKTNKNK